MRSWKFWLTAAFLVALHIWYAVGVWGGELHRQLHDETQQARASRGLPPQSLDDDLCRLCQRHAEWMASRDSMFHGSGENVVAYGTTTPGSTVRMWLGSPPHRAFLLGESSRAGWGAAQAASGRWYWAGAFRGSPSPSVEPAPIVTPVRGFLRIFRRR